MTFALHPQLVADTIYLGDFELCRVLLMNDAQFPWLILVPRVDGARELYELDESDLASIQAESILVSRLMMTHFSGDKLNTGALGNMVPQLHLHHIVRFKTDAAWPKPVWGSVSASPYSKDALGKIKEELQTILQNSDRLFTPC